MTTAFRRVVALSGGVGGARFLDGLARVVAPGALTAVVNTGDDFVHLGLNISPDLDTVMYTLAGLGHEERGWGLADESYNALGMLRHYGAADWFTIGDRDLATHLLRTEALREGTSLSRITEAMCGALGITARILPMCDTPRPTLVETEVDGTLGFQQWFVEKRTEPAVRALRWGGTASAPAPGVLDAIDAAEIVVFGPSNPYVSIDPILALDGVRDAIARKPVVAVSPIVGGKAVKGPLAVMIEKLAGEAPSPGAVARHYRGLVKGIVVETGDEASVAELPHLATATVMRSRDDRVRLAREVLAWAEGRFR